MNDPIETYPTFELLTIEEYAKRLQVGRTTIYEWKSSGKLIPQQHFIQKARIIRFIWDLETIRSLHENDNPSTDSMNLQSEYVIERRKGSTRKSAIDLNY
jgi:predicted DNA-binding transcriptional regulator AlpA